jgi:membrane glycosyltransferase
MTVDVEREAVPELAVQGPSLTTPAGLQAIATLNARRLVFLALNLATWMLLLFWTGAILSAGGWTLLTSILLMCVALGTPWTVLGFWNATIGLWQLRDRTRGLRDVAPFLSSRKGAGALTVKTAVLMTLRNEDPARALLRLKTVKASLDATGHGARFSYFVLSDTDRDDVALREEEAVAAWRAKDPDRFRIVYRRRSENSGFKAGNVRDFCLRWGDGFELMLPLDADSLMTGSAIVQLARVMQSHPKLGILQSLVVGAPSSSAFARIFQFGMRLGMRTYTMGQAWWTGDCGPFWGHNALLRIKPFAEHCVLPALSGTPPLGGDLLSHDQVEAVLMRRAGFEVRVMPVECGSYEDNPPDAIEFGRRDVRWCQGNMQYLKLLGLPGLQPVSRFQLLWAVLMFASVPAWSLLIALLPFAAAHAQSFAEFPSGSAVALYLVLLLMYLMPKLAAIIDAVSTAGEVRRFGGPLRFATGAVIEIVFSFLLGGMSMIRTSIFMTGLLFGKSTSWSGQRRDVQGVRWTDAMSVLWPQFLFGIAICVSLAIVSPVILLWSLPVTSGFLLAVPFTVLTASPATGRFLRRHRIAGIPEDFAAPREIGALQPSSAART